ncbi:MAG: nucleotide exchange factor GrpE [Gammaproteobacteria bacterium]|nr:nucleotide exchange factor GrpE [Gammaproteobacteria bacterium]
MAKKDGAESESPELDQAQQAELTEEEPTEQQPEEESAVEVADDLPQLLEDARAKADEHWNQLLRANAGLENTRRRARQDVENAHKYALEKFALELLPVKDSLEMGLAAVNTDGNETATQLREGTEMTLKVLTSAFDKFGIEAVDPVGDSFDPALHQAMSMQESADHAPNTVMAVMQKGYRLNERLIRPAMVVVSKAVAPSDETPATHVDEKA